MIDRPIDDDVDFRPSSRLANSVGSKRRWRWLAPIAADQLGRRGRTRCRASRMGVDGDGRMSKLAEGSFSYGAQRFKWTNAFHNDT